MAGRNRGGQGGGESSDGKSNRGTGGFGGNIRGGGAQDGSFVGRGGAQGGGGGQKAPFNNSGGGLQGGFQGGGPTGDYQGGSAFQGGRGQTGPHNSGRVGSQSGGGSALMQIYRNGSTSRPDPKVTELENTAVSDLSMALAATSLDHNALPRRPAYGKVGLPVILWTNYFELKGVQSDSTLYRYQVDFQDQKVAKENKWPKPKKKRLIQLLLKRDPFSTVPIVSDWAELLISTERIHFGVEQPSRLLDLEAKQATKQINLYKTRAHYDIEWYPEDGEPIPPPTPGESIARANARKRNTKRVLVQQLESVSVRELLDDLKQPKGYSLKLETIQALNIVIGSGPSSKKNIITAVGNKRYPFDDHPQFQAYHLGTGLQALRGYFTSVRTSVNRILVNINVATGAFYKEGALLDIITEVSRCSHIANSSQHIRVAAFVKKLRIETNYIREIDNNGKVRMENKKPVTKRKVHTITALSSYGLNSTDVMIQLTNPNRSITVQDYFQQTHGIKLRFPKEPLVNHGSEKEPKWIPVELCRVLGGQIARRALQGDQTRNMIAFAARRPFQNAESIENDGVLVTQLKPGLNRDLPKFGIEVNPTLLKVHGRILQAPTLQYRGAKTCQPQNGSWNLNTQHLGQSPFRSAKALGCWNSLIINLNGTPTIPGGDRAVKPVLDQFVQTLDTYGMCPGPSLRPHEMWIYDSDLQFANVDAMKKRMETFLTTQIREKLNMLFVILPNDGAVLYDSVKHVCDVKLGIPNICSIGKKLAQSKIQYFANVAMKFNQKLGGINHCLSAGDLRPLDATTIVFGIDVTHPSPGSFETAPSIAGIVASVDANFAQYHASMRMQKGRQEMVSDLEDMVLERLRLWQKHNSGRLPASVIVYRDGVSEGQYATVMKDEYPSFVKAFETLYGAASKHPKVSIIVVGKRHHTRFYPTDHSGTDGKTGNPKPGTVVDRGVTGEQLFDFFLLAHQGLQGTSKPAHYVVLKDDNKLGADQLQILTHNLCYTFARATRAVSVCPPAYYADILCERGRSYLHTVLKGGDFAEPFDPMVHWTGGVHENLAETMYYL